VGARRGTLNLTNLTMTELFTIEPCEPPPLELARIKLAQMVRDLDTYRPSMTAMQIEHAEGDIRAQEMRVTRLEKELL